MRLYLSVLAALHIFIGIPVKAETLLTESAETVLSAFSFENNVEVNGKNYIFESVGSLLDDNCLLIVNHQRKESETGNLILHERVSFPFAEIQTSRLDDLPSFYKGIPELENAINLYSGSRPFEKYLESFSETFREFKKEAFETCTADSCSWNTHTFYEIILPDDGDGARTKLVEALTFLQEHCSK